MPIHMPRVQRRPPAVGALRQVARDHARVQQRIAVTRSPVAETSRNQPATAHLNHTASAPTPPARLPLHVPQCRLHRRIMRLAELPGDIRAGDAPQHTHRLRRPRRQIEARHRALPSRTTQPRTAQQMLELADLNATLQPDPRSSTACPAPGGFPLTGVVILTPQRHLIGVVPSRQRTRRDLAQREHHPLRRASRQPPTPQFQEQDRPVRGQGRQRYRGRIAARLDTSAGLVGRWRRRFAEHRLVAFRASTTRSPLTLCSTPTVARSTSRRSTPSGRAAVGTARPPDGRRGRSRPVRRCPERMQHQYAPGPGAPGRRWGKRPAMSPDELETRQRARNPMFIGGSSLWSSCARRRTGGSRCHTLENRDRRCG